MHEAVLMLYGEYENADGVRHPDQEDMFPDRPDLDRQFMEHGSRLHIGRVLEAPSGPRELGTPPRIEVAQNPIYDKHGTLLPETVFEEGSLTDYQSIIDHWVANFQDRVPQPDGSTLRTAYGLGVPNEHLWNCRPIQYMANDKTLMEAVLAESGVGIPTYNADTLDALVQEHPGAQIFYKPVDGSLSKGTAEFDTPAAVLRALQKKQIARSGILQPYLDLTSAIRTLRAPKDNAAAAQELAAVNSHDNRLREVRMHTLAYTDEHGNVQVEAYPTLKYSLPNTRVMKRAGCVALDPESIDAETYATTKNIGQRVISAAITHTGEPVTQYYGTVDWVKDTQGRWYVIDVNCRGPRLTIESPLARAAFARVLTHSGRQNRAAYLQE
ncbi:MAG TPA: hypothetical protein VJ843_02135 [Candidatus Saccharimonadales bacterium]|nr:hypothetical protein [Candidatus Saccharimonadales bacterium]